MDFNKALFGFIKIAFSIMIALIVIVGALRLCTTGYDFGYRVFTEPAMADENHGEDVLVQIRDDMSESDIGQLLEDKGLVEDGNLFYLQLKLSAYSGKIKPGVYTLNTSMTAKEMIVVMSAAEETSETESTDMQSTEGMSAVDEEGTTQVEIEQ